MWQRVLMVSSQVCCCGGSNVGMTRTPDVHFLAEARHAGPKELFSLLTFASIQDCRPVGAYSSTGKTVLFGWRLPMYS